MTNNNKIMDEETIKVSYEEAIDLVLVELNRKLSKSPLIIRDYTKHLMNSQGKFIRAKSVIICAQDNEGKVDPNAIKIAAAIELLHLATLVHDDIIDDAELRRGDVTLQKKYGKRTAVICGDYLLSVSLMMVASINNKKNYVDLQMPDYVGKVCIGELNQHVNSTNVNLSMYQYFKIIAGKTAALFEASFFGGSVFSDCSEAEQRLYKKLGFNIGMIFQLSDDCIDFDTAIEVANKPVQSDYENGVVTLPLIYAFDQKKEFKDKALHNKITRNEINDTVAQTGGLNFTRLIIKKYYKKSVVILDQLDLSEAKKEMLMAVLSMASRM